MFWCNFCCSRESMCRECIVNNCFITYHKAQIDKLSADVAEMAIAPSKSNIWSVCLNYSTKITSWYSAECYDVIFCDICIRPAVHLHLILHFRCNAIPIDGLQNLVVSCSDVKSSFYRYLQSLL